MQSLDGSSRTPQGPNRDERRRAQGKAGQTKQPSAWRPGGRGRPPNWSKAQTLQSMTTARENQTTGESQPRSQTEPPTLPIGGSAPGGDASNGHVEPVHDVRSGIPDPGGTHNVRANPDLVGDVAPKQTEQAPSAPAVKLTWQETKLAASLAQMYGVIGMGVYVSDAWDGGVILSGAIDRARELVIVSRHHANMRRVLLMLTQNSDYLALAVGHGSMLALIMMHHGLLSVRFAPMFGQQPENIPVLPPPASRQSSVGGRRAPAPGPSMPASGTLEPQTVPPGVELMGHTDTTPEHNPALALTERRG